YKGGIVSLKEYAAKSYDRDIIVSIIVKKKPVKMFYEAVRITETDLPVLTCAGVGFSGSGEYNICIGARPGRAVIVEDKEGILKGGVNDETIESFARYVRENVSTESNMRGSAEYRSHLAEELTKRALRVVNN
ncbi:MAG: molybdopterin dehydrogenase, partial [Lachnospira pectinoschiza]